MEKSKTRFQRTSNSKGITLVALVITIVIIIILSTVAISFAFGDNGLIKRAEDAGDYYTNDTAYTEGSLTNLEAYIGETLGEKALGEWDTSKVISVVSSDGVTVPVPIGYTASSVKEENSVIGGFVIYEGTEKVDTTNLENAKKNRNQFVWIPVDNINQIAKTAQNGGTDANGRTNYQSKLYNFNENGAIEMTNYGQDTTNYREPDVVTYFDNNSQYITDILGLDNSDELKIQLQEEFNEMIESIETYGGFYIGRYETGNLESAVGTRPRIVKEDNKNSNVNWYYMYQNSKLIKANDNVESTMIWGNLWDRTLIWLTETKAENSSYGKSFAELHDASSWGNYTNNTVENHGILQSNGYSDSWKTNNIYDLAGNAMEWTLEAFNVAVRIYRGGSHAYRGPLGSVYGRVDDFTPDTPNR